jgi:hypothetical protein
MSGLCDPFGARHPRRILREWISHYNQAGRIVPSVQVFPPSFKRLCLLAIALCAPCFSSEVIAKPILGGLHHEYRWRKVA